MTKWTCCKGHYPTGVPGSTNWPTVVKRATTTSDIEMVVEKEHYVEPGNAAGKEVSFMFEELNGMSDWVQILMIS